MRYFQAEWRSDFRHMDEVTRNHPEWLPNLLKVRPVTHQCRALRLLCQWNLVNQFWYTLLQFSIKMCFLLFYYRLTDRTGFRRWLWAIVWFHVVSTVVIVFIVGLQAVPLAAVYEPENYPNAARIPLGVILFVTYGLTLATDVFILILPLPIVFSLQMSAKRRMTVLAVVTTGGSAVLVCGLRGIVLVEASTSPDFTFTLGKLLVMLNIELQVAIIAANMPSLKSFYTCWRQQMLGPGQAIGAESLDTRSRRIPSKSMGDIELQSRQPSSKFLDSGDHHGKLAHDFSRLSSEENTRYFNEEIDVIQAKEIVDANR